MTTVNPASTKKPEAAKKPDFEYSLDAPGRNCRQAGERQSVARRSHETVRGRRATLARLPEISGAGRRAKWKFCSRRPAAKWPRNHSIPNPRKIPKRPGRTSRRSRPPSDEPSRIFRRRPSRGGRCSGPADARRRRAASFDPPRHALQRAGRREACAADSCAWNRREFFPPT